MKITSIEAIPVRMPFTHAGPPTGFGGQVWNDLAHLLVRVETDDGLVGWGESFGFNCIPTTKSAIDTLLAPIVVGRNADDIDGLTKELYLTLHLFGRYGVTVFALSGFEMALWDLAGKREGKPLHALLGGADRDTIPAYASLFKYEDPEVTGRVAARACEDGFTRIKLHECTMGPVESARAAIGEDVPLLLDVNCVWHEDDMEALRAPLQAVNLHWLEEPVWPPENYGLLARLRSWGFPVATGENACTVWQFRELLDAGAADYAQPSVTKVGGVAEFAAVVDAAHESGRQIAPHSPYFGPGFLATLHLIAARAPEAFVERLYVDLDADLFGGWLTPENGAHRVPDGPGLGADPDPELLERYRVS